MSSDPMPTVTARAVERLGELATARECGATAAPSDLPDEIEQHPAVRDVLAAELDEATERELWERCGRVLRERDSETYRLLRGIALVAGALLDAPVAS